MKEQHFLISFNIIHNETRMERNAWNFVAALGSSFGNLLIRFPVLIRIAVTIDIFIHQFLVSQFFNTFKNITRLHAL